MTRKEEIRNASVAYNEKAGKLLVIGGDSILSEEEYLEFNKNPSFIAGAEWADDTMLDRVCKVIKEMLPNYVELNYVFDEISVNYHKFRNNFISDLRKSIKE